MSEVVDVATPATEAPTAPAAAVKLLDDPARDVPNGRPPAAPAAPSQNTEAQESQTQDSTDAISDGVDEFDPEQALADKSLDAGKKGKNWYSKKMAQITREKAEAQRVIAQQAELLTRLTAQQQPAAQQAPAAEQPPTQDQFPDFADYLVARSKYESRGEAKQVIGDWQNSLQTNLQEQRQQFLRVQKDMQFATRLEADRAGIADYADVVGNAHVDLAPHVEQGLKEVDAPAKVIYYLAKHPEIVEKINGMSPINAYMAMGQLNYALKAPKPRTSNAPPPGEPAAAKATGNDTGYREDMTGDEYHAWKLKRRKA